MSTFFQPDFQERSSLKETQLQQQPYYGETEQHFSSLPYAINRSYPQQQQQHPQHWHQQGYPGTPRDPLSGGSSSSSLMTNATTMPPLEEIYESIYDTRWRLMNRVGKRPISRAGASMSVGAGSSLRDCCGRRRKRRRGEHLTYSERVTYLFVLHPRALSLPPSVRPSSIGYDDSDSAAHATRS